MAEKLNLDGPVTRLTGVLAGEVSTSADGCVQPAGPTPKAQVVQSLTAE